jgi:hypothetical protein
MNANIKRKRSITVMRYRTSLIALVGLIVAVVAQPASAQTFVWTKQPVKDGNTGLVFRDTVGFKFQRATIKNDASFQYDIDFKPPVDGQLRVSVFEFGPQPIPEGADTPDAKSQVNLNRSIPTWGPTDRRRP